MFTYSATASLEYDLNLTLPSVADRIGRVDLLDDDPVPATTVDVVRTTLTDAGTQRN